MNELSLNWYNNHVGQNALYIAKKIQFEIFPTQNALPPSQSIILTNHISIRCQVIDS